MSRKKKVITILHLCFAFSYLSWLLILPYGKAVISQKSELALYEVVLEHSSLFQELSSSDKLALSEGYEKTHNRESPSFLRQVCSLFFLEAPSFALAWLFFSIIICLLLLFQIEGAHKVVWLLPFLVVAYAYFTSQAPPIESESFFPSEDYVISHYADEENSSWFNKRKRLLQGWHGYLITEWGQEQLSQESAVFEKQLERALFAFNVARLKWILSGKKDDLILAGFTLSPSFFRLFFYLLWNLFFAWFITRKEKHSRLEAVSNPSSPA